jgi:serine/threonine protein kinase
MLFDDSLKDWMQFEDVVTATLSSSNIISTGRFTTLYKAMLPSGEMMAVKVLNIEKGYSTSHYKKVCMQLESWVHEFHHKHLMMPIGFILYDNSILLLYDDAPYGSIGQSLHTKVQPNVLNTWTSRYRLALGAAQGLAYLHHSCEPPIIHLDITSHNIFLCGTPSTLHAQLGDAELLKLVEASNGTLDSISAVAGSVGYIAPGQFPLCFQFCAHYRFFPCVNVSILSKSSKPFILSPITILNASSVCLVWDFNEVSLYLCRVKILCPLTSGFIKEKSKANSLFKGH